MDETLSSKESPRAEDARRLFSASMYAARFFDRSASEAFRADRFSVSAFTYAARSAGFMPCISGGSSASLRAAGSAMPAKASATRSPLPWMAFPPLDRL